MQGVGLALWLPASAAVTPAGSGDGGAVSGGSGAAWTAFAPGFEARAGRAGLWGAGLWGAGL